MNTKIITAAAVAISVLAGVTGSEAGGKKHGHYKPHHGHNYEFNFGHHNGGGYFHINGRNCKYIYRKARATDSQRWWRKFERCISRY